MSLKRVLGTMLASRMAGRGRGRGSLGTAAMLGALGHRRRGMGGKLGLAALGYMAYRAYQDQQARTGGRPGGAGAGAQGGIGGMIREVADRVTGGAATGGGPAGRQPGAASEFREDERAAEEFSDDTALLLIRAMIAAAYSDGALSETERGRIMQAIDDSGADAEDRRIMQREIAEPRPLDELIGQVRGHEMAEQFYLASRAAIDGETAENRAWLAALQQRLGLSDREAAEVDQIAS